MAKSKMTCTLDLIANLLFPDGDVGITKIIDDGTQLGGTVDLVIEGPGVPDAEHVICEITDARRTVRFRPA